MNAKSDKTKRALTQALERCLQRKGLTDVSVSELAREANVSRSTFYAHFDNVADVFDLAVREAALSIATLDEGLGCRLCPSAGKMPFCENMRRGERNAALFRSPLFLSAMLSNESIDGEQPYIKRLTDAGITDDIAKAVCRFQLSGCYAAATAQDYSDAEWTRCRTALDTFIRAGMEALGVTFDDAKLPDSRIPKT